MVNYSDNITKMNMFNRALLLLGILFFVISDVYSQKNFLEFQLKVTIEKGNYETVRVTVTKDGNPYKSIDYKSKYSIDLDLGHEYVFTATKQGYITKSIIVDTNVPEENAQDEFAFFQSEIILKAQPEEQEITYTQPVGMIAYSPAVGDFDYDKDYSAKSREMEKKAEAEPRKKPKTEKEEVKSNPEIIKKDPELKKEPNPQPKPKPTPPPPPPKVIKDIVERIVFQDKVKITYRTVTINGVAYEYRKEEHSWGGVYFYKNNKNITEALFEKDTNN